jgi:hypothetical protein
LGVMAARSLYISGDGTDASALLIDRWLRWSSLIVVT